MRREYLLTLVKGVSCEGQERPLTMLEEHHMHGKHVCPRWKISNIGRVLSLHSVCTVQRGERNARKHHKGRALVSWNWRSAFVLCVWSRGKTHENVGSHLKLWFSNVLLSQPLFKEGNHICICAKRAKKDSAVHIRTLYDNISKLTRGRRGREVSIDLTVTVYSTVKLITLNYYMKVSCGCLGAANLTVVFWQSCHLDCRHVVA